ncbi:MAG: hypothetical protein JNM02_14545 [Anaerolineales bacterium]|nr:hypothetical protein [Anaerolineales bacterium]
MPHASTGPTGRQSINNLECNPMPFFDTLQAATAAERAHVFDAPIIRVAQKEVPLPYNRTLEQAALPQVADITAAVKEVLK